jgi:hypothetical protein
MKSRFLCLTTFVGILFLGGIAAWCQEQKPFEAGCDLPYQAIAEKHDVIDDSCPIDGSGRTKPLSDVKIAEDRAKNSFCVTGSPVLIRYSTFLALGRQTADTKESELEDRQGKLANLVTVGGKKVGEGSLVRFVGFVVHAQYSDVKRGNSSKYGEAVNCYRPSDEENDIHIMLGRTTDEDPCGTVTAEMSPHYRPLTWTPENVMAAGKHPVRITGQMFFDSSHKPCTAGKRARPPRASVWEIHPVYSIEVCQNTSLAACSATSKTAWVLLNEWSNADSGESEREQ